MANVLVDVTAIRNRLTVRHAEKEQLQQEDN